MRVLGVDPGSRHTGYGVLEGPAHRLRCLAWGRISPPPKLPLDQRLLQLHGELSAVLERWQPDFVVLESLFRGVNAKSLIVLAQARGALLTAMAAQGAAIHEYSPAEVKVAVTGSGRADKEQVSRMVCLLLRLTGEIPPTDATDALAVAICGLQRLRMDTLRGAVSPPREGA